MTIARPLALVSPDHRDRRERERARKRRYRARLDRDCAVAPVEYSNEVVSFLIDTGWLDSARSEDRLAVGDAISRAINDAARDHHNR